MAVYMEHDNIRAIQFIELLVQQDETATRFIATCNSWLTERQNTLSQLHSLASDIDKHHKNVNIASLSGSSVSVLGGAAIIGGLALAPFTGGISLGLTVGGTVAGVAGGAVAFGSSLAELGITHVRCKNVQKYLDDDKSYTEKLIRDMDNVSELSTKFDEFIEASNFSNTDLIEIAIQTNVLIRSYRFGKYALGWVRDFIERVKTLWQDPELQKAFDILKSTMRSCGIPPSIIYLKGPVLELGKLAKLSKQELLEIFRGLLVKPAQMSKALKFALGAVSMIVIAIDIWAIVKTTIDMKKGSRSIVGTKVRTLCEQLDDGMIIIEHVVTEWN